MTAATATATQATCPGGQDAHDEHLVLNGECPWCGAGHNADDGDIPPACKACGAARRWIGDSQNWFCPGCGATGTADDLVPAPTFVSRSRNATRLVSFIKRHAAAHYDEHGWDVVVECWTDQDIADAIGWAETEKGAIRKILPGIRTYAGHRADIEATAF
jgi:hypothetical protein